MNRTIYLVLIHDMDVIREVVFEDYILYSIDGVLAAPVLQNKPFDMVKRVWIESGYQYERKVSDTDGIHE